MPVKYNNNVVLVSYYDSIVKRVLPSGSVNTLSSSFMNMVSRDKFINLSNMIVRKISWRLVIGKRSPIEECYSISCDQDFGF